MLVFDLGPVERFDNLGKFRGYVGSVTRVRQSGDTQIVDGEWTLCNRLAEAVLSRATLMLICSNRANPIEAYYRKYREQGYSTQQVKARARGSLAKAVYAMLRKGEPYAWSTPEFADRKVADLERAATAANA